MHEYSIVQSLLEVVERHAQARNATVKRVVLKLGDASGVDRRHLELAYDTFREHTVCEEAELAIVPVAVRWQCPKCGAEAPLRCAACAMPAKLVSGDEIVVDHIDMEVP